MAYPSILSHRVSPRHEGGLNGQVDPAIDALSAHGDEEMVAEQAADLAQVFDEGRRSGVTITPTPIKATGK